MIEVLNTIRSNFNLIGYNVNYEILPSRRVKATICYGDLVLCGVSTSLAEAVTWLNSKFDKIKFI